MSKNSHEFSNVAIEKKIIRHLLQNKEFCNNVMMFSRIVDGHFTQLFNLDAFHTIQSYHNKYGTPPPDLEKFNLELEKNFTPTDTFKLKKNQLEAWQKGAKNLFNALTDDDKLDLQSDLDVIEEYRKKRIIQSFLYFGNDELSAGGDIDSVFDRMAKEVKNVKLVESVIMEGNIVDDWEQHEEVMRQVELGIIKPVPSGIIGSIEDTLSNSFKKIWMDDLLDGGFFPGELTIIVGENNVGKSFALMEIAYHASKLGFNVLFFSIEMNKIKQQRRIYSRMTKIPYKKFKLAILNEKDKKQIKKSLKIWEEKCGILHTVSFDKGADVTDIINKTKDAEIKYNKKFDLFVIDYLNDMKPIGEYISSKNWDAMGEISWDLAQLSKYYNNHAGVPVVTANQKKTTSAGSSRTAYQDAAFSPLPLQHATVGIGLGQGGDDADLGRIRWDLFKSRDGEKGISFYTYPDFVISKISSSIKMNEYYEDLFDEGDDD